MGEQTDTAPERFGRVPGNGVASGGHTAQEAYGTLFDEHKKLLEEAELCREQREKLSGEVARLSGELRGHRDLLLEVFAENHNLRKTLAAYRGRERSPTG